MTYVKTYLPTLKTHVVNLKRDAKDLSRDLQRLEARGKLGLKLSIKNRRHAKLRPTRPSHSAVRHNIDPVSHATST